MKKNGYFTPKAERRHIVTINQNGIKQIKKNLGLKPKTRYVKIAKLVAQELKSQIRNSIQY